MWWKKNAPLRHPSPCDHPHDDDDDEKEEERRARKKKTTKGFPLPSHASTIATRMLAYSPDRVEMEWTRKTTRRRKRMQEDVKRKTDEATHVSEKKK